MAIKHRHRDSRISGDWLAEPPHDPRLPLFERLTYLEYLTLNEDAP